MTTDPAPSVPPVPDGPPFVVKESGTVPTITHVPAYVWRCEVCGWLGAGLVSERAAEDEAAAHTLNEHGIAGCAPEQYGGPHLFEHVKGSDSLSECAVCGWVIGK